jgi:hypothetical protein
MSPTRSGRGYGLSAKIMRRGCLAKPPLTIRLPTLEARVSWRRALGRRQRPEREVVEFFLEPEAAEAMIREVCEDDPDLAELLRVEAIAF